MPTDEIKKLRYVQDHVHVFIPEDHNDHVDNWKAQVQIYEDFRGTSPEYDSLLDELEDLVNQMFYVFEGFYYSKEHHNLFVKAWRKNLELLKELSKYKTITKLPDLESAVWELKFIWSGAWYYAWHHNAFARCWDIQIEINKEIVVPPPPPVGLWLRFRADMKHTGRAVSVNVIYFGSNDTNIYALNPDGTLKWYYSTGDAVRSSPAVDEEGTVYIGSDDDRLYALNPDGTLKWSYLTGDDVISAPAVDPDVDEEEAIYVGSYDYYLYAFNPDGTLRWRYATGSWVHSPPNYDLYHVIYFGSYDSYFYALNPDGTLKWRYLLSPYYVLVCIVSPAIDDASVSYFGTLAFMGAWAEFYALNPDGTLKWSYTTVYSTVGSSSLDDYSNSYFGTEEGIFYKLNSAGSVVWTYNAGDPIRSSPALDTDGTIYFGAHDLIALNPDGTLKWSFYVEAGILYSSPAINPDGYIYFGDSIGKFYAIDKNGNLVWTYITGDAIDSSPACV